MQEPPTHAGGPGLLVDQEPDAGAGVRERRGEHRPVPGEPQRRRPAPRHEARAGLGDIVDEVRDGEVAEHEHRERERRGAHDEEGGETRLHHASTGFMITTDAAHARDRGERQGDVQQPARRRCLDVDDIEQHEPKPVQGVEEDREEEQRTRTSAAASSRRARGPRRISPARSRRARRRGRGGGGRRRRRPRSRGVRGMPTAARRGRSRGRSARSSDRAPSWGGR